MQWGSLSVSTGPRQTHPVGASDTQARKKTQRWLLHALFVSMLPCLTWARLILKDILNKSGAFSGAFFFSYSLFLLSFIRSQEFKPNLLLFPSLSLCISFFLSPPPSSPPPPPLSLCFQQRPKWFGETKAPLVLFDLLILMSMNPDGGMTTLSLEKHKTEI